MTETHEAAAKIRIQRQIKQGIHVSQLRIASYTVVAIVAALFAMTNIIVNFSVPLIVFWVVMALAIGRECKRIKDLREQANFLHAAKAWY